jgi:hypothetical protein
MIVPLETLSKEERFDESSFILSKVLRLVTNEISTKSKNEQKKDTPSLFKNHAFFHLLGGALELCPFYCFKKIPFKIQEINT